MLGARSVAVVGASARPDSFGARMVTEARRGSARVQLVNPRYDRIDGMPCAPALESLDETPDLVLLGVPDASVADQLSAAAKIGARAAVLFGSAHGADLRARLTAIATEAGMAVCGAGCMGFIDNTTGVRALGYLEPDPLPAGGIALVTHSGSAFSTLLRTRRGFGFRRAVSSGQELVTDTADYVEYSLDDPGTTLIGLLMETPRSAPRLRAALRRAAEQDVPVVILTVGGSPRGAGMVAAHSGALAGDTAGWTAFCAATGAIRVTDLAEFTDTLELFAAGRRVRRPGGIATVHDSGAERALCADLAHDLDVSFVELAPSTVTALDALLDDGLHATNPLDVWGTGADTRTLFGSCLRVLAEDPAVAVTALAVDLVSEFDGDTAYADAVLDVAGPDAPIAVLASVPAAIDPDTAQRLRANGVPVLEGMRSGLAALGHLTTWPLPAGAPDAAVVDTVRQARWRALIAAGEIPGFDLLADYGIPVVATRIADTVEQAVAAAQAIGYPVALKTTAALHKTEVGGVVLNLVDDDGLRTAYTELAAALGPRVSVDAMAAAGVEVSVGVVHDAAFGPLLVVAAGGVLVELLGDRAVASPPIGAAGAQALVASLRVAPLLAGWRGSAPVDVAALVGVITGFSQLAIELGDVLAAVEANPVIVSPLGAEVVDVLVIGRDAVQKIE